jgi:hypothetical protein
MEMNQAWISDERHREQLAVIIRDDVLSLSRFIIQDKKRRDEIEERRLLFAAGEAPETPSSSSNTLATTTALPRIASPTPLPQTVRPHTHHGGRIADARPSSPGDSSQDSATADDDSLFLPYKKRVPLEAKENMALAKAIVTKVIRFLGSASTRFKVAERLLEIEDEQEQVATEAAAANKKHKKHSPISEYIKNILVNDDEDFLSHTGIFTVSDVRPFFRPPSDNYPKADNHFVLKLYSLVEAQSEPEEAIVDLLDKTILLLGTKTCAFPPSLTQSKEEIPTILHNKASEDTTSDVVALFGKARDASRPYTAGPVKSIRDLYNTDQFVLAAAKGDHRKVAQMLKDGQPIDDESSTFRYTALHAASDFGKSTCVNVLLKGGATVNMRNKMSGKTPLHYAAESRRFDVCQILMDAGASKRTRDSNGLKALYYGTEVQEEQSLINARCLRDAPGRIMHVNFVSTSAKKQLSEITMDWSEPKNLGYDQDPIDHHRILWRAVQTRATNPLYYKFLGLLQKKDVEEEYDPQEHDWVHEDSTDHPYCIKNLKPAEQYQISIRAHADGGYSPESHPVTHTSASSVTSTPGIPVFMTSTSSSVTVAWLPPKFENGEPVKSYQVYRQILIGHETQHHHEGHEPVEDAQWVAVQSMGSHPVASIKNIPNGGFIKVKVRSRNANGTSEMGEVGGPFQALDPIRVLDCTPSSLKIIWQTVPAKPVLHFELQIRKYGLILSEDDYRVVADDVPQNIDGITYQVEDLLPGTDYQFRIRAFIEGEGWQSWPDALVSNVFRTQNTAPGAPSQPYDKIGASTATSIVLKWDPGPSNGKAIGYFEVYWKTIVKDWELLSEVKGPPVHLVENLEVGQSYFFKVRAHNEIGWSPLSEESEPVSTNPIPIPGKPTQKNAGIGWVELEWAKPIGELLVDSYEIQKRIISTDQLDHAKWEVVVTTCQPTSYLVQELKPCAKYQFRVRALTFDGWSSFSVISDECECKRRH